MRNTSTMLEPNAILKDTALFASFAVKDIEAARQFYGARLGLDVRDSVEPGLIEIHGRGGTAVLVYPKPDHQPAVFTVLNLPVSDIDEAVDALTGAGVKMERYDGQNGITTDAKGIARGRPHGGDDGPSVAWFRDPSGNVVSLVQDQ